MKIIGKSNFDNEMVNDVLIVESVNHFYGKMITDLLNEYKCDERSLLFFELKEDNYKLYEFKP